MKLETNESKTALLYLYRQMDKSRIIFIHKEQASTGIRKGAMAGMAKGYTGAMVLMRQKFGDSLEFPAYGDQYEFHGFDLRKVKALRADPVLKTPKMAANGWRLFVPERDYGKAMRRWQRALLASRGFPPAHPGYRGRSTS